MLDGRIHTHAQVHFVPYIYTSFSTCSTYFTSKHQAPAASLAFRHDDKMIKRQLSNVDTYLVLPVQNVMAKDDGAIPGESESTDGLIDQYRR